MEHHARLLNRPDPVEVSMRRRLAYGPTEGTRCGRSSSHSRGAATRRQWWRLLDPDDRACEESKGLRFRSVGPAAWGIAPGWAHALALLATGIVVLGFVATVRTRVTTAELLVPLSPLVTLSWPFPPYASATGRRAASSTRGSGWGARRRRHVVCRRGASLGGASSLYQSPAFGMRVFDVRRPAGTR